MKKIILTALLILTVLTMSVFSFAACSDKTVVSDDPDTKTESITIAVPDGGPALGMSYLMKHYEKISNTTVTYKIVDGAAGIKSAVMSGEADVAIMPTNMAAILYNQGIEIQVVGTNSYGLLYMLSNSVAPSAFTFDDLKGEVLNTVGQGGTPEIVLKKVLEGAGIEYVESDTPVEGKVAIKYHTEGTSIIGGLKQGTIHFAVLGEPAVSTALQKVGGSLAIVCDLQEKWKEAADTESSYPQTALVAKKSLIESDPLLIRFIAKYTDDCATALREDAAPYIAELKDREATVPDTFGKDGVSRTNIKPAFGATAKTDIEAYLSILKDFKPQLIGGKLPDAGFYYDLSIKE